MLEHVPKILLTPSSTQSLDTKIRESTMSPAKLILLSALIALCAAFPGRVSRVKHRSRKCWYSGQCVHCCFGGVKHFVTSCPKTPECKQLACPPTPSPSPCPGSSFGRCSGPPPDVPFFAKLVNKTFETFNDCRVIDATLKLTVKVEVNKIIYTRINLKNNKPDPSKCTSGWTMAFTRIPSETVLFERVGVSDQALTAAGGDCNKAQRVVKYVVTDRNRNPIKPNFCGILLDLHRNSASVVNRDTRCPKSKSGNAELSPVVSFMETLAYQLSSPLDLIEFIRPSVVL